MSISVWMAGPSSPLARAMKRKRLSNKKLNELCGKHGIDGTAMRRFAEGHGRPTPWLAKAIADMFGSTVEELFPVVDEEVVDDA